MCAPFVPPREDRYTDYTGFSVAVHRSTDEPVDVQRVDRRRGVLFDDHPRGGVRHEQPVAPHRPLGQLGLRVHALVRDLRRRRAEQGRALQLPRRPDRRERHQRDNHRTPGRPLVHQRQVSYITGTPGCSS